MSKNKITPTGPEASPRSSSPTWPVGGPFPKTGHVFTPDRNETRSDYQGAFLPESMLFQRLYGIGDVTRFSLGVDKKTRRKQVIDALATRSDLDVVAFFCHGLKRSLPQLDFNLGNVGVLADALAAALKPEAPVVLYCCSTGGGVEDPKTAIRESLIGEGGFADALRDALVARGWKGHIDAHERAAHTTKNPLVRRFLAVPELGGRWIFDPEKERPAYRRWMDLLHQDARQLELGSQLRFRFPFMTIDQIREYVR